MVTEQVVWGASREQVCLVLSYRGGEGGCGDQERITAVSVTKPGVVQGQGLCRRWELGVLESRVG